MSYFSTLVKLLNHVLRCGVLKNTFPKGTRICVDNMGNDPHPIPAGICGTVVLVDDIGTIHYKFDNGRLLALIPEEANFHIIKEMYNMNIDEKINKMNELLAEVNKLAEDINKEHNVSLSDVTNEALKMYIQNAQDTDINNHIYWINEDGEVVSGVGEYLPNNYNPYCNYMRKDYADKSAKLKKFYDILLAFKWSNDKNYEPDWTNTEDKYYIYYDVEKSKYDIDFVYDMVECIVYFESSEIAEKCANYLTCIDPEGELIK